MQRQMLRARVVCAGLLVMLGTTGCSTSADVSREELVDVIQRDGVVFTGEEVPGQILDRLAGNRVVVLGETHHLREHWEFVANLLAGLHEDGFRQVLVEQPQMVDWLLDDWVVDGGLEPDWIPPPQLERMFSPLRALNLTLAPEERVHVRSIDVNEQYYGGAEAFLSLLGLAGDHLPDPGPIADYLTSGYVTRDGDGQSATVAGFLDALHADEPALVASWGRDWYDRIVEMAEVELASIDIRAERSEDDNSAARMREEIIKRLVDARIGGYPGNTVVNIGGHHAQKSHLKGTEQEWLGDYLVHRSTAVDGAVFVVSFTAAKIELEPGSEGTPFDVLDASPGNEILRVMVETWPGETVFVPLDDPLFIDRTVAVNSEGTIYVTALKNHYDAVVQYGLAHRMPSS